MRILIAATILLAAAAEAAPQTYWVCVDDKGHKTAQDHPCPESNPTQRPGAAPEQRSATSATPDVRSRPRAAMDYSAISKAAWTGTGWVLLALLAAFSLKVLLRLGRKPRAARKATRDVIPYTAEPQIAPGLAPNSSPNGWTLGLIRELEWLRFEELCCEVWKARGYKAEMTSLGEDGGVDVVIRDEDGSASVVIQCKSWTQQPVGVERVRALWGAKDDFKAARAVLYGLSGFSDSARRFAQDKALDLLAGQDLLDQVRALPLPMQQTILDFVTRGDYVTPSCPTCGKKMVRRAIENGEMWGCPSYPRCRSRMLPVR